jgi:DNA-binding GntR family transcriptional regulator
MSNCYPVSVADAPDDKPVTDQIVDILFHERAFEDNPLTEQILGQRLGRGRSQIRDALNRLEAEDLIQRRKKKGVYVNKPTPKGIAELYDLRIVLEAHAARQVAHHARDEDMDALQEAAAQFEQARLERNFALMEQANTTFHETLVALSRNDLLVRMMHSMNFIRKAFKYAYEMQPELQPVGSTFTHEAIVSALRARDADLAEALVRSHIQIGKERVLEQALGFRLTSG